jgi:hypothetical protein
MRVQEVARQTNRGREVKRTVAGLVLKMERNLQAVDE